jgi:hypothetical protein
MMATSRCHVIVLFMYSFFLSSHGSVYCLLCLFLLSLLLDKREKEMGGKRTEKKNEEEEEVAAAADDEQKHETRKIESILLSNEGKKRGEEEHIFFIIRQATHVSRTHRTAFYSTTEIEKKRKTIFPLCLSLSLFFVSCLSSILVYYCAE